MIDTGTTMFGKPVHQCEPGEKLGSDRCLPAIPRRRMPWIKQLDDWFVSELYKLTARRVGSLIK